MPNSDLTDIKIALATLEQSNVLNAQASLAATESSTKLTLQMTELIGTIKESNVKYDLMIEGSVNTANATSATLNDHLKYAEPILLRSKRSQDNVDMMYRGIFSKMGWLVVGLTILGISVYLNVDPSKLKL
tara:strand:- start:1633 stop:2025 length:393 start_codon:yes stop_codon:yes gene_type:complete